MKFCPNCGNKLNEGSVFCPNCGNKLDSIIDNKTSNLEEGKTNKVYMALLISIITSCIACFLPVLKVWFVSVNFVYNNGHVADGIFVVIIQIIALIALIYKKRVSVLLLELLASLIFVFDFSKLIGGLKIVTNFFGIGFYLLVITLSISIPIFIYILQ